MGTKNVNKQLETVISAFPVQFTDEITYDLLNDEIDVVYNEKEKSRNYYINIIDNYGYKHRTEYHHFMASRGKSKCITRFFYGNPYTYENINLYCKLNNIVHKGLWLA